MTDNVIDLDEIVGELKPLKVIIDKKVFWANPDPSVGILHQLAGMDDLGEDDAEAVFTAMRELLVEIFDEKQADVILNLCGIRRVTALIEQLIGAYQNEGKVAGSSRASRRAGARSKATSRSSTASTSEKRALARNGSAAATSRA